MEDSVKTDHKLREFELAALEYIDNLFSIAFRMTGNRENAEDIVQETYLKVHRFSHTFKEDSNLKAWLIKILRNTFINSFKKKIKEPKEIHYNELEDFFLFNKMSSERTQDDVPDNCTFSVEDFLEDEVKQALGSLPLAFKEIILYSDIEDLTYEEISDVIGCPIGTVKSRLFRARKLLQKLLWDYAKDRGYLKAASQPLKK